MATKTLMDQEQQDVAHAITSTDVIFIILLPISPDWSQSLKDSVSVKSPLLLPSPESSEPESVNDEIKF